MPRLQSEHGAATEVAGEAVLPRDYSIALCHEWLTTLGGSEQVAQRMARALGIRDIYTAVGDPLLMNALFGDRVEVISTWGRSGAARRHWRWFLPMMGKAWSRLDLSKYDIVVTSSHACVNAIRTRPDVLHISYCHTPMRYAWEWEMELGRLPAVARPWWPKVAAALRAADYRRAQAVTLFLANSNHVAQRIRSCYGRSSVVLHPPIDTQYWTPGSKTSAREYFLFAGRLVDYKQPAVALRAAQLAGVPLVVAGSGPELRRLQRIASPTAKFADQPSKGELRELYRGARALVLPGVEDFGMTMIESQACGTPVLAFNRGGAREAVIDGVTGRLYPDQEVDALAAEMRRFDPSSYSMTDLLGHASTFDAQRFDARLRRIIDAAIKGGSVRVAAAADL